MSGQEAGQPRQRQQQSDVGAASSKGRTTLGRVSFGTSRALPDHIVARRTGNVLIKHTILKSDHFPGCQNKKLLPLIEGAPNFRQVPELPVYGVAIPTVSGMRLVLDELGAAQGQRRVMWFNMREEPVIYINGNPYVVREANKPFANLEYTGIDRSRVEDMENRLKQDVLQEAAQYNNQILVAHENDDFQVVEQWEAVTEVDVQTPLEVYRELSDYGYEVEYTRVPVTDEKAPKEKDFALLMRRLWKPPEGAALIFNCQMGRGRTSTGMIIASLLHLRRRVSGVTMPAEPQEGLPSWFMSSAAVQGSPMRTSSDVSLEAELKGGKYGVVRSLLRVLEGGTASKALLDTVIDACNAMQNLREAITGYRGRLMHEGNDVKRNALLQVCLEYLERYYVLIAFTAYLFDPSFNPESHHQASLAHWMKCRPELYSVLQRMLRRNPLAALSLQQPSLRTPSLKLADDMPFELDKEEDSDSPDEALEKASEERAGLIASRAGEVLGAHTILKEDHFPGCQSGKLPNIVPGAPNFRGVPGQNVYGSALPTVEGIKEVLQHVGAASNSHDKRQVSAVWHNMREEPVIYINGRPFVLREDERPFKNLQEYTGIDVRRLEQMELRLKNDILQESTHFDGQVLVAREAEGHQTGGASHVVDTYEPVAGPESVQTPREVYDELKKEGYRVQYYRLPLTDGEAPKEVIFDVFFSHVKDVAPSHALIFNCQMGGGRTTTGMVIGCLIRMHTSGNGEMNNPPEHTNIEELVGLSPRSDVSDDYLAGASPQMSEDEDAAEPEENPPDNMPNSSQPSFIHTGANTPEVKSLKEGEYVGVRRFTRILERGTEAKSDLDKVIDRCGGLVNLRTAIMRYRKPRRWFRFYRPEINVRDTAFKRGTAYLERYCLLIAFTSFLEQTKGSDITFQEWMSARPDVFQAKEAIHQNPAGALAPVPLMGLPLLLENMSRQNSQELSPDEQKQVLGKRRGNTLSRRSILKSYHPTTKKQHNALHIDGVSELRQAKGMPVYTMGTANLRGLRRLLSELGARPGGRVHVVVTDLREELVAYVNGSPYLRRELEMPSAALHHAGIQAMKLEELERRLRTDIMQEAIAWAGRVMLHKEVSLPLDTPAARQISFEEAASPSGEGEGEAEAEEDNEDVTTKEDAKPDSLVSAYWETIGNAGEADAGLASPLEVYQGLAADGYQLSYRRVPLSRERTPEAADLDVLHHQLMTQPVGQQVVHLIVSRTATGSSCRFVAAFAVAFLQLTQSSLRHRAASGLLSELTENLSFSSAWGSRGSLPAGSIPSSPLGSPRRWWGGLGSRRNVSSFGSVDSAVGQDDDGSLVERSASSMGEYRGIMNLCRVLPQGTAAKLAVDKAIDRLMTIGSIREDIQRCKEAAEVTTSGSPFEKAAGQSNAAAARRLGLHYLQRYFYLITFVVYLESSSVKEVSFARWMADRKELKHLLSTLSLEPAI